MEYILRTHHLSKHYKGTKAVDDVNLSLRTGEIYGFLGENGAGKTTTIRMIMGLIRPTKGWVELFGEKIKPGSHRHFQRIGTIIENPGFYQNLSAVQNLEIHRQLMDMPNKNCIEETLELVGLLDVRNRKVKKFSLGMKQRLGLARALMHHPELLILDEPTNGLDPAGIKEIRQLLLDLAYKRKITIMISSHILSEIQQLATRVGIIHQGKLIEEVNFAELQKRNRNYIEIKVDNDKKATHLLEKSMGLSDYQVPESGVIRVYEQLTKSGAMNRLLVNNGIEVSEITLMGDTLEDYFLKLTGGVSR